MSRIVNLTMKRIEKCTNSTVASILCGAQWRRVWACAALVAGATAAWQAPILGRAFAQSPPPQAAPAPALPVPQLPGYGGLWYDDTGQGAVEIASCGDRLCGKVAWLKAPLDKAGRPLSDGNNPDTRQRQRPICGLPVIGGAKRQRDGSWDEGWIYDPKQGKQFDVELKLRAADALQVTGYLGVKFLSETFVWRRAPAELKRCG